MALFCALFVPFPVIFACPYAGVTVWNCGFIRVFLLQFLRYGLYIHGGLTPKDDTQRYFKAWGEKGFGGKSVGSKAADGSERMPEICLESLGGVDQTGSKLEAGRGQGRAVWNYYFSNCGWPAAFRSLLASRKMYLHTYRHRIRQADLQCAALRELFEAEKEKCEPGQWAVRCSDLSS